MNHSISARRSNLVLINKKNMCCIAVIQRYTYTYGNIVNTIMMNENTSFEKYTSHTLFEMVAKRLQKGYVWEVSWRLNKLQHIDPQIPLSLAALLSRSAGLLRAHSPLLGAGSLYSILSPTNWLQTNWTSCRTGLYHCLMPTCFLWALHLHPIQPVLSQGYILMSLTGCTCFSIDGWAEGQYVTNGFYQSSKQQSLKKNKESEKIDKYLDLAWELKTEKVEGDRDATCCGSSWNGLQSLEKRLWELEIMGRIKPFRPKHCWTKWVYLEDSWRPEETFNHSNLSEKPPVKTGMKNL